MTMKKLGAQALQELLRKYKAGTCSPEERDQVEQWLMFYKKEPLALTVTERWVWRKNVKRTIDASFEGDTVTSGSSKGERDEMPNISWKIAASILLIISSSLLLYQYFSSFTEKKAVLAYKESSVPRGTITHLLLGEGTEIWLNAGSVLRYPERFTNTLREVNLEEGEAYFVVKHEKRPFIVRSGRVVTHVLGTAFNIRSYADTHAVEVAVSSGRVGVMTENQPFTFLTGHESAIYDEVTKRFIKTRYDKSQDAAWRRGEMRFDKETFAEAAHLLENRFDVSIRFDNNKVKSHLLTASFDSKISLSAILKALCKLSATRYKMINSHSFVIL